MKFSERWLREWVDPPLSTGELAARLTGAGLEVDSVEPVADGLRGVVVAGVVEAGRHPRADRLSLCRVDAGTGELLSVVCGAPNVRAGMRAALALPGARLPGGVKVRRSRIRGEESQGMLCSARELGLGMEEDGIVELARDAPVGRNLSDELELEDVTIDIELTPNRGDCLGIAGIAREVGTLTGCVVSSPAEGAVAAEIDDPIAIRLEAPADCPRYVGRVIRDIDARAETPLWMRERLRRSGLRSISPVVDVTNYVMLELGQPMHAFDLDEIELPLRVRRAHEGERLLLLDETSLELDGQALVIADGRGAVALAGVMGGAGSGVGASTRHILLESAWFHPRTIAVEARRRGLHSDASHRFERSVATDLQCRAMERATALLLEIVGGRAGPVVDECREDHLPEPARITLRASRIRRLLGLDLSSADVEGILTRLGMRLHEAAKGEWRVVVPPSRPDVTIEADLIEELARVHGYDRIPDRSPAADLRMRPSAEAGSGVAAVREVLASRGYQEAVTFSFVNAELQAKMNPDEAAIPLANPISSEMAVMRTQIWPGLTRAMLYNTHRQRARVRLFETGLVFHQRPNGVRQESIVAGLATGPVNPEQWGEAPRDCDFFDIKGDVEALIRRCRAGDTLSFESASVPALHPGRSARVLVDGMSIGSLGEVHPGIAREWKHSAPVHLFELSLSALSRGRPLRFEPLSKDLAVRRDLAVVVDESVTAEALRCCVGHAGVDVLDNLELFDVYRGEGIDPGKKSLAIGLSFRHGSRSLVDTEVEQGLRAIVDALEKQFGAVLRG